jgi:capsule biosynthesis phosphatase
MKRLVIDLDGTITREDSGRDYPSKLPNDAVVAQLRAYKAAGFEIVIHTARNMQTYEGAVGKINAHTLPIIIDWLQRHDIPYDEIHVAKPWCGRQGFYVDDRAIRPSEFAALTLAEIHALLAAEHAP